MGLDAAAFLQKSAPEKAAEHIERLSQIMRNSLGEVRSHIHQISPNKENEELAPQLQNIVRNFALHTKMDIEFEQTEAEDIFVSAQGTLTLIRCLQESLTNAVRHGHANKISVSLKKAASDVVLQIRDNGIGMSDISFGFGLNGMKERLELLQGQFTVESKENEGTAVTCVLPVIGSELKRGMEQDDQHLNCG